jgi:hypothetical protein
MAALSRAFSHAFPANSLSFQIVKQIALFSGAGLFVSLLLQTWGLYLSPGLFLSYPPR